MADNRKATYVVDIITKGLKQARAGLGDLGKDSSKISGAYTAADKAGKDFYNTQAKGIIGTANSTKSFSKLAETMNSGGGIVGAYATLAANIFAVTAAFNALRAAAQVQQVEAGLTAMGNRMGTTLSVAAENVREISKGTLTVEQSLRSAAQIASAGFGTKSMEDLANVANDVSFALGRNMTDSMDRLTRGVVKLEPELLDELGLMTKLGESTARYANVLGKSETQLSNFEKRQGFMNAIVAEGQLKFGGLADEAGNLRNMDQLGATFQDLTKDIFNFLNNGALPLAAVFSNKGVLLGGMLLFASTISKQLLPGLSNLSIKTAQSAQQLTQLAKERMLAIPTDKSEPRAVKGLRRALDDGRANAEHYGKAIEAIDKKEASLQAQIARGHYKRKAFSQAEIAAKKEEIGILEDQKSVILETMILETQGSARATAANAILAASQGKIRIGWRLLKQAVAEYGVALAAVNVQQNKLGWFPTVLTKIRVGFFAATVGARALGAALISMMGTIGIVVSVVWGLIEAFKYLKELWDGPDVKRFNEAISEQDEILGQLSGRYEEMKRVRDSGLPIAQREQAIYKVMTNTIRENIEAYEKVKEAQDKVFKNSATVEVGQTREFETLKKLRDFGAPEVKKQIELALGKEGLTGILDDAGRQINKGDLEKLSRILSVDLRQGAATLGDHITDLADAFKTADEAIAEFNRSAIPSTPYDTVVKQLDSVTTALTNISSNAALSDNYMNRMAHSIAGAGENLKKFFSVDTQQLIKEFNELDARMSTVGYKATAAEKARGQELAQILALRSSELYDVQELFAHAQSLSRLTQVQITQEQVRLDKLNKYTALTGSSIRERRAAENHILQLQANQIKAQADIVKRQLELTKIELQTNTILLQRNAIYQQLMASAAGLGDVTSSNFMTEANARLIELSKERPSWGRSQQEIDKEKSAIAAVIGQYQAIRGLNIQIRDKQDQLTAASAEYAATLAKQTSQLVINAEANATNAQTAAGNADKQLEVTNERIKLEKIGLDIQTKLQGRVKSTAEEYTQMVSEQQKSTVAQMTAIANQTNATVQNLRLEQARAAGNQAEIAAYDKRIASELQLANLKMQTLDAQNRLNILEKFSFDIHKAGLEMQRDSLQYLEKRLDAESDYVALQREGRVLSAEIARKRSGRGANDFTGRGDAIREAQEQLELAREQASMRKAVIKLEYALLDAQRQLAIWNLQAQRQILGANTEQGKQLAVVIGHLQNGATAIADAQRMATDAVDLNISNLAKKLESLGLGEGGGNFIGSGLRDFVRLRQLQSRAVSEAKEAQTSPVAEALETHISPLVESNVDLNKVTTDNTAAIKALTAELLRLRTAAIPSVERATGKLGDYASQAKQAGFRVSEINAQTGHTGRGHREGRAFDMNIGRGNIEANSPAMRARMDEMAQKFVQQGLIVLWNGKRMTAAGTTNLRGGQHRDHMHVEIPAGSARVVGTAVGVAITAPIETMVEPALATATQAVEQTAQTAQTAINNAANDNIPTDVVTAKRGQGRVPRDFESLSGYFQQLTGEGDFNMLTMFEEMAEKLGPEGQIVPAIINGINSISGAVINFQDVMASDASNFADKFAAGAAVAQTAIATISSLLTAAADARVAAIDREIAAEQRRDGKSAESVAKIQAMERKKDAIQRKAFNVNKKLMMAQAVIATAAGVAQALTLGPIVGPIMAAVIAALGAAQIAIISGTNYQSTASANFNQKSMPDTLTIGKRGDTVDVARHNQNLGGELSYLRGTRGTGSNSANYNPYAPLGSAYGGPVPRGYGNNAFVVGEKGPEVIERDTPINVRPINDNEDGRPLVANFNITAFDGQSVYDMLHDRRGDLIDMFRETANANGSRFMEDVNTSHYKKARASGATKI